MTISYDQVGALAERIRADFGVSVHICAEIEWLFHQELSVPDAFFERLLEQAKVDAVKLESIGREKTNAPNIQQYEFRFKASDSVSAAKSLYWLGENIAALAEQHALTPERTAFVEKHLLCSGLHWHLHLLNENEDYLFMKQEDEISPALEQTLGGLLATMPALMPYFTPSENSYQRLTSGADHVPTKVCWGGNNRSVALRMPESVIPLRHIEHRICGSDADPMQSIWAILVGIHYGLTHEPVLPEQCHGDASRPESDFPFLPKSQDEAQKEMEQAEWLADYSCD